jgi:DNA replication and repair protein RecF
MRLRSLTLRQFRNVGDAALAFAGRQQFLVGANGQGKTNLLEAAGFLTALRSFRTTDGRLLIGHGQAEASIVAEVEHEREGDARIAIRLGRDGRELWCDQERVTRLADHLGRFPTVVFSSQDQQLVRGAPAGRRRWLDLTLASMDAGYLQALQTYARALAGRNALLKRGAADARELGAFEQTLAPAAAELIARRADGVNALAAATQAAYSLLSDAAEPAGLAYAPDFPEASAGALCAKWEAGRARDAQFRTTLTGPHRDDLALTVRGTAAKDFGSEGQQRSLVLALRLAQTAWFREKSGVRPVLLADDVLGELDPARRRRFWAAIDPASQVIATGTSLPDAELGEWQVFEVKDGAFAERGTAIGGTA